MSDSEYSSDDDEDYVPEVDSASDEGDFEGQEEKNESKTKSAKNKAPKRKHKGGIKLDDEDDDDDDDQSDEDDEFEEQERIAKEQKKQEKDEKSKKAHMEDLWASFKSDTANVRAKPTTPSPSTSTKEVPSKAESTSLPKIKDSKDTTPAPSAKPSTSKVTITMTFDFAGEAVTVTKTVDAGSDEAKKAQKQQEEASKKPTTSATPASNLPGVKRTGGLGNLLGQIGKKPKMNTLEKSKLDWDNFKTETGISDDLKNFNKNGYLDKQDFLQRTDERLFEREKHTRAAMRKQ